MVNLGRDRAFLDWQSLAQYISPEEQPQAVKAFLRDLPSKTS